MIKCAHLLLALTVAALLFLPKAWAEDANFQPHIFLNKAFLSDPSGSFSIQDVLAQKFTPHPSQTLSRGYTSEVSWMRLRIKTNLPSNDPIVIRIQPHFLDQISLYGMTPIGWVQQVAGDRIPYSEEFNDGGAYKFLINPNQIGESDYYLRLKTSGLTFMSIEVMTIKQAYEAALNDRWYYGLQFGVLVVLLFWGISNYLSSKDLTFAIFSIFQFTVLLFNMSAWGTFSYLLPLSLLYFDDFGFSVLYILRILTTAWLGWSFLRKYNYPKWYTKTIYCYLIICILEFFLVINGYIQIALISNSLLAISLPIWQIWATIKTKEIPTVISRMIIVGYSIIFWLLMYVFSSSSGFIEAGNAPITLTRWIAHINGFIFFLIVWKNNLINQNLSRQRSASLQLLEARSAMEKKQLQERSTLIDMLIHELKNPLATIKMASGSLKFSLLPNQIDEKKRLENINCSVDNMNAVIERCALADQIDQDRLLIHMQQLNIADLINEQLSKTPHNDRVKLLNNQAIEVQTDPLLLSIAIGNLLENAIKYSAASSMVKVRTELAQSESGMHLEISIANEIGLCGYPNPDQIFKRYYRNPYAHNQSGTGLGLYLTKSICELLGGQIVFEQSENTVVFTIKLVSKKI
jgi:signal transduction histidine kinase